MFFNVFIDHLSLCNTGAIVICLLKATWLDLKIKQLWQCAHSENYVMVCSNILHSIRHTLLYRQQTSDLRTYTDRTSMSVLWIRNCSAYSQPMTSHALGGLAGSRQTLLHMQQWAAGRRHRSHLESMTSYQKDHPINWCMFTWKTIPPNFIPIRFEMIEP